MSNSRYSTRTITGSKWTTAKILGLRHVVEQFTTINEALNLSAVTQNLPEPLTTGMEVLPEYSSTTDSSIHNLQVLIIGNGAHRSVTGTNNEPGSDYTDIYRHLATDTGLYRQIPFVLRPVTDDLTVAERRNYCLRRTLNVNGILYVGYFGRLIVNQNNVVGGVIQRVSNNVVTETNEFVPTIANLKPARPVEDTTYNGLYGSATLPEQILFTQEDIQNLKDACSILYGNPSLANISELGLCAAALKPVSQKYPNSGVQTPINIQPNTFFEAVACQIVMHITTYAPLSFLNKEYGIDLNLGNTEPLFGVSSQ